jgi:Holliday junction resolvasome RuvABC endonuclease subunit
MPAPGGILALDLSLTTGFAYGVFGERPVWGHWQIGRMEASGEALAVLEDHCDDAIRWHRPRALVYEAPIPANRSSNGAYTIELLLQLAGIAKLIAVRHGIPYYHQNLTQARSKVLGKAPRGKTEEIKSVIIQWAAGRGWDVGKQDDQADALLLLAYSSVILDKTGKAHFNRYGAEL